MLSLSPRALGLAAALAAGLALGVALASEAWGGLVPCALCLWERWPYRVAIGLGVLAALLPPRPARVMLGLAVAAFVAAGVLGFVHVGVEQGFWPSPLPECAAPRISGADIVARLRQMPMTPAKPCDEPTFLLPPVPLSMASMNMLYALASAAILAMSLRSTTRGRSG
jgi:disulfide bond formation protein DsbB